MLHKKKSPLLSISSGQGSEEIISDRENPHNLMHFANGKISIKGRATPGCCLATSWLIQAYVSKYVGSHQSRGELTAHLGNFCCGLCPARRGEAAAQTETDGGGETPQSVSLSPLCSLPLHKHWVTSCSLTLCTHILLCSVTSCCLPPGPLSNSVSPAKAELLALKQVLKVPWELIDKH